MPRSPDAAQKRHWDAVAQLNCLLTGAPATIAHCHGGSIIDTFGRAANPGMGQRQNHWLVIPLSKELHQGHYGLDTYAGGVWEWESLHQSQVIMLEWVCHLTDINVFEKAGLEHDFTTVRAWEIP